VLALGHRSSENPLTAYVVLAVSGVAEGTSLVRVLIQFRNEARRDQVQVLDRVRSSADTTVKAALFEDSAAMVGLALAALGLALRQVTGSLAWDGAASIAIGGLLVAVAVKLGLDKAEDVADEIDRRLVDRLSPMPHVFLHPTQAPSGSRSAVPRRPSCPGPDGAFDNRAAHSSIPACTKACGRLPRSWRW
jgi:hypothetical protein